LSIFWSREGAEGNLNKKIGVKRWSRISGKKMVGEKLKQLPSLPHFQQLVELLQICQLLATSEEYSLLHSRPIANASLLKEQQRLHKIYHFIETNYQKDIDVNRVATLTHLTTAAFCRYFKKHTGHTFIAFLNEIRINEACKKLTAHKFESISTVAYKCGFKSITNFNRVFKCVIGTSPREYLDNYLSSVSSATKIAS